MGNLLVTEQVVPQRLVSRASRDACLVQVYPSDSSVGTRYRLGESPVVLGRDHECGIRVEDHSVSRRHARVERVGEEYLVSDLGSTNGTSINEMPADRTPLIDGTLLRVGNCLFRFLAGNDVEAQYHEELYQVAIRDFLTDLPNGRALLEFLGRELARSRRHARPLAMVLIEVDRLPSIVESLGSLAGDLTLRQVATCLKSEVERDDLLARYSAEIFALVLVEAPHDSAVATAERLRRIVEGRSFTYEGRNYVVTRNSPHGRESGPSGLDAFTRTGRMRNSWKSHYPVTVSMGVATTPGGASLEPRDLIRQAEEALEMAKQRGRNTIVGD
jgi:two-component system cell cycle response regulator